MLLGSKYGNFFKNHFLWIKGSSGTLKSFNARKFGNIIYQFYKKYNDNNNLEPPDPYLYVVPYIKDNNKWFQNYNFQKIMILEEVDRDMCMRNPSRFKRWFDQYPFPAEIKGIILKKFKV